MAQQSNQDLFSELSYYTLAHPDTRYFIHQHIVDAYTAQTASEHTKPIAMAFALAGLYLYIEKNYSGREVQHVHQLMTKHKNSWPAIDLPDHRGEITITTVLSTPVGPLRDAVIKKWCASVWNAYGENRETIISLVRPEYSLHLK